MTTDRERFERGRRFLKAVSSNFANDSDDQEGKEWRDAAFFLQRAALAQPVAPGEPTYQDGVKDGLTRAAPDYKALAVAASLEAVLPLLRTIQGMGIPGDHDEIIARAAHNLAVYRKCAEAQQVAGDEWPEHVRSVIAELRQGADDPKRFVTLMTVACETIVALRDKLAAQPVETLEQTRDRITK